MNARLIQLLSFGHEMQKSYMIVEMSNGRLVR